VVADNNNRHFHAPPMASSMSAVLGILLLFVFVLIRNTEQYAFPSFSSYVVRRSSIHTKRYSRNTYTLLWAKKQKRLVSDDLIAAITTDEAVSTPGSQETDPDETGRAQVLERHRTKADIIPSKDSGLDESIKVGSRVGDNSGRRNHSPKFKAKFAETLSQPAYVGVTFDKVMLRLGNQLVLNDLSFTVGTGDKAALLGPNGIGKVRQDDTEN
jgi:ATPase subunit of ABC transporter with duplicated ATPase domains